jgi:hypothetical protein
VVERLVATAGLSPLTAVRLAAVLHESVADDGRHATGERLLQAYEIAEPRDRELARALSALRRLAAAGAAPDEAVLREVREALRRLDPDGLLHADGGVPADGTAGLVHRDPLAFALASLMEVRLQRLAVRLPGAPRPVQAVPEAGSGRFAQLEPFARLLGGRDSATEVIWLHADAVLPPAQALAAALAMQEVRGERPPDWGLLRRLPCFTLPLDFLDPARPAPAARDPGRATPQLP